jgi:hypothetical protein
MNPTPSFFDQLLQHATGQREPQRLLFLFAGAELPPDADAAQRAAFAAGRGGALVPLACVDKSPRDLSSFDALVRESRAACPPWDAVFIAALGGTAGQEPTASAVDGALHAMADDVRQGRLARYLALGRDGDPLVLQ